MLDVMIVIMTIVSCYAGYLVAGRRGWVPQLDFNSYLIRLGLLEDPAKYRVLPETRRKRAEEWIKADHTNLSLDLVRDVAFAFPLRVQQLEHELLSEDTDWQHEKTCTVCYPNARSERVYKSDFKNGEYIEPVKHQNHTHKGVTYYRGDTNQKIIEPVKFKRDARVKIVGNKAYKNGIAHLFPLGSVCRVSSTWRRNSDDALILTLVGRNQHGFETTQNVHPSDVVLFHAPSRSDRPVKESYETRSMYEKRLAEWEDYTQNHREPYTSVENGIEVVTLCGCGHCNGEY